MTTRELINTIRETIPELKTTGEWEKLNYLRTPVTILQAKRGNEVIWNKIVTLIDECIELEPIQRTRSGGVSISNYNRWRFHQYDIRQQGACVELTLCDITECFRLQWRINNKRNNEGYDDTELVAGGMYFRKFFKPACEKFGINLPDYKIDNGKQIRELIRKPDIQIYDPMASFQFEIKNAHHLDFHKFYASGLIQSHPEFKPVVEYLLQGKEGKDFHKTGLASIIGWFYSAYCGYKYAGLAKDAINTAYEKFDKIKAKLGNKVLATNTDGIWYKGEVFHGEFEGPELGQWQNDYENCLIRFKSKGAYEFICEGKYYPVVRGFTLLDRYVPREDWVWGDIFQKTADVDRWKFDKNTRLITWENKGDNYNG